MAMVAMQDAGEEALREALDGLTSLRALDEDVRRQVEASARSTIQYVIDRMERDYRKTYNVKIVPQALWKVLHTRAYLYYVRHCACLMKDLKAAAFDPSMRF